MRRFKAIRSNGFLHIFDTECYRVIEAYEMSQVKFAVKRILQLNAGF